jgi:hypothetical protein
MKTFLFEEKGRFSFQKKNELRRISCESSAQMDSALS